MSDVGPPSDNTGLQWLVNLAGGIITLLGGALFGLVQMQLNWLRGENRDAEKRVRDEMSERFDLLDVRDDERRAVQAQRHQDNQAEMERIRQTLTGFVQNQVEERRRFIDAMERLVAKVSDMPTRAEVRDMLEQRRS